MRPGGGRRHFEPFRSSDSFEPPRKLAVLVSSPGEKGTVPADMTASSFNVFTHFAFKRQLASNLKTWGSASFLAGPAGATRKERPLFPVHSDRTALPVPMVPGGPFHLRNPE